MKKTILLLALISCSLQCFSQNKGSVVQLPKRASNEKAMKENSLNLSHEYLAGNYLCKSSYLQYLSMGTGIIGAVLISSGIDKDNKSLTTIGYITAGIAVTSQIVSIAYKLKAGKQMKLSATSNGLSASVIF